MQLVHQLEDTYRARYKSDYFPQKGEPRRPRYVADNRGNHFVSLQVQRKRVFEIQIYSFHFEMKLPAGYSRDLSNEYIRVSLITTPIGNSGHFYSPYKFQTHHRDAKILDENPIFLPVGEHKGNGSPLK